MQVRQNFDELVNSALASPEGIAERKAGIQAELQKQYLDEADDLTAKGEGEEAYQLRQKAKIYKKAMLARPHAATISEKLIEEISKSRTPDFWKIQGQELSTTDTALGKILTKKGRDKFLHWLYEGGRENIFDLADKLIEILLSCGSRVSKLSELLTLRQADGKVSLDLKTSDGVIIKSIPSKDENGYGTDSITIDGEEITHRFHQAEEASSDTTSNKRPSSQSVTVGPSTWSDKDEKQIFLIDHPAGPRYSAILGSRDNTGNEWSKFPVEHDLQYGIVELGGKKEP